MFSFKNGLKASILSIAIAISTQVSMVEADTQITCPLVKQDEITQLFSRWNTSLQTGKPSEVVKNYATDAVLLPTVSNKVRRNHGEIQDYFVSFLTLKPKGQIDERKVRVFCDIAIDSGIYTFDLTSNGKVSQTKARYTFVYKKTGNNWLIVEHHSSVLPEKVGEASK
jgi:uncharacterized protein (TIGR02246 family)